MTLLQHPFHYIGRMTARHWAWLHFKVALGLGWGSAILFSPPPSISAVIQADTLQVWAIGTILGALVCIVGIFMTLSYSERWKIRGLSVEIVGLILMGGGPFQYFLLQVGFLIDGDFINRYQLTWFAYSMLAAIIVRGVILVPQFVDVVVSIKREKEIIDRANDH